MYVDSKGTDILVIPVRWTYVNHRLISGYYFRILLAITFRDTLVL